MALFVFRLPKGNGKGGESAENAGFHERRELYKLQGPGRSIPSTGQQEDRNDPHAYSAEKAESANGVHGRALFVSGQHFKAGMLNIVRHGVKTGLSGKPPHDGTVQPSHCFNPILTVG
ncbi:MAG: hypothetical protein KH208_02690 [Desulfovibrio sp.]|uniref:hypothetical protein n=1 Tax=Desulfovibrio sp. TaxID=885 RepID=UPI0025C093FD|nr:hypothetical protein [Desulfovibrio sp.]MBS6828766.1 hypothetical protein [Desulfovibrio sp.]